MGLRKEMKRKEKLKKATAKKPKKQKKNAFKIQNDECEMKLFPEQNGLKKYF